MSLGNKRGAAAALLVISMLASLALAQAASAATISTKKACYVAVDPDEQLKVPVTGSGYTPGEKIVVEVLEFGEDDSILGYKFFIPDANGKIAGAITNTYAFSDAVSAEKVRLRVRGGEDEATLVEAPMWMAYRELTATPWHHVKPHQTITLEGAGFKSGKPLYAHYVHDGKQVMSAKVGKTTGPCGLIKTKTQLFPFKHSHFGEYDVQYDNSKKYNPKTHPKVVHPLLPGKF